MEKTSVWLVGLLYVLYIIGILLLVGIAMVAKIIIWGDGQVAQNPYDEITFLNRAFYDD